MKNQRYNIIAFWGDSEPWFLIANEHTIKELEKMGARVEINE